MVLGAALSHVNLLSVSRPALRSSAIFLLLS